MSATPAPPVAERTPRAGAAGGGLFRFLAAYGLLLLLLLLIIGFSVLLPNTFPTAFNARSILSDKSIIALLALAQMVPIATGNFDLSIGYHIGLAHILAVGLQVNQGVPWPLAVAVVLALGVVVGLVNGLLVTRAQIDAFIASLGVGTVLYGVSFWYAPVQIVGALPEGFDALAGNLGGVPLPFVYVVLIGALLFVMFEYLPLGRYLYVLGSNPRAAELTGIPARVYVPFAFVLSGVITAFAGVVLGAKLGVAQTTVGPDYLLPAFVGALLGSTAIKPGRVNVLGTVVAVFVLAVAVAGLQQLGAQFFVEPLFNGSMLILAVGLAAYASRRRARVKAAADAGAATTSEAGRAATDVGRAD
jgi:ribose transport system permease protein